MGFIANDSRIVCSHFRFCMAEVLSLQRKCLAYRSSGHCPRKGCVVCSTGLNGVMSRYPSQTHTSTILMKMITQLGQQV
jgi:hypothetical protein